MRYPLILISALALSACGESPDQEPLDQAENAAEAPMPVEPDGGIGDGAGPPEEAPALIPARFQGAWDYVGGTCAPESDLRMEISGGDILFYEAIGTVTAVATEGDDVVVTLAMEGEGETWEQQTRLSLSGTGEQERLATSDGEAPESEDDYSSRRCPQ